MPASLVSLAASSSPQRHWKVTVFADETGQQTTSAAAAAVLVSVRCRTGRENHSLALTTYERLRDLSRDLETGVSMIEIRQFARTGQIRIPVWAKNLGACRIPALIWAIDPIARERFGEPPLPSSCTGSARTFTSGYALTVPLIDTTIYLDYLTNRFCKSRRRNPSVTDEYG